MKRCVQVRSQNRFLSCSRGHSKHPWDRYPIRGPLFCQELLRRPLANGNTSMTNTYRTALPLLLFSAALTFAADGIDPRQPGPYQVGVRTEVFVDSDRTCAITNKPRTLVTEIWYPAGEGAASRPLNTFADFFGRDEGKAAGRLAIGRFGGQFDKVNESFKNRARRNAPVLSGKFPLLI